MDPHPLVYMKNSKIHGKGLFAKKKIKAGKILGELQCSPTKTDGPHVLWLQDEGQAVKVNGLFKYINHHKEPNACYYDDLTVVALKDINKNEEITHHYGDDW